eukprot:CAMPEP_0196655192 /NCGR_PEP_ID=MMETSP1086-20130531/4934_1 /TAXON_ID=77921 /ORGANISM="Cyanoptyche  gloeocystis , Strain SAG4.97" /LENGTH=41 /DNA_ID= /DNA_START= /DNA_END= /DNA_ORIENTATION=
MSQFPGILAFGRKDRLVDIADLIDGSVIVLRQGKKNYRLVR